MLNEHVGTMLPNVGLDGLNKTDERLELSPDVINYANDPLSEYTFDVSEGVKDAIINFKTNIEISYKIRKLTVEIAILKAKVNIAIKRKIDRTKINEMKRELLAKQKEFNLLTSNLPTKVKQEVSKLKNAAEKEVKKDQDEELKQLEKEVGDVEDNEDNEEKDMKESVDEYGEMYSEAIKDKLIVLPGDRLPIPKSAEKAFEDIQDFIESSYPSLMPYITFAKDLKRVHVSKNKDNGYIENQITLAKYSVKSPRIADEIDKVFEKAVRKVNFSDKNAAITCDRINPGKEKIIKNFNGSMYLQISNGKKWFSPEDEKRWEKERSEMYAKSGGSAKHWEKLITRAKREIVELEEDIHNLEDQYRKTKDYKLKDQILYKKTTEKKQLENWLANLEKSKKEAEKKESEKMVKESANEDEFFIEKVHKKKIILPNERLPIPKTAEEKMNDIIAFIEKKYPKFIPSISFAKNLKSIRVDSNRKTGYISNEVKIAKYTVKIPRVADEIDKAFLTAVERVNKNNEFNIFTEPHSDKPTKLGKEYFGYIYFEWDNGKKKYTGEEDNEKKTENLEGDKGINRVTHMINELDEEVEKLEEQYKKTKDSKLKDEIASKKNRIKDLESQLKELENQKKKEEKPSETTNANIKTLDITRGKIEDLTKELQDAKEKYKQTGERIHENRIKGLTAKIESEKKKLAQGDKEQKKLLDQKEKAVKESINDYLMYSEAAQMEDEIRPIVDKLNRKGYLVKYASPGHAHLRKKEDKEPDGVYYGHLYSDARVVFKNKYDSLEAPKYWHFREDIKDCSYLDITPIKYDDKDGTPDEVFKKWKTNYMNSLREFADSIGKEEDETPKTEIRESMNIYDFTDDLFESMENAYVDADDENYLHVKKTLF